MTFYIRLCLEIALLIFPKNELLKFADSSVNWKYKSTLSTGGSFKYVNCLTFYLKEFLYVALFFFLYLAFHAEY